MSSSPEAPTGAVQQFYALIEASDRFAALIHEFSTGQRQALRSAALEDSKLLRPVNLRIEKLQTLGGALHQVIRECSPHAMGDLQITLGRSLDLAQFFAFRFLQTERLGLEGLVKNPFLGSGVYAIYYEGCDPGAGDASSGFEPAYGPIRRTETPIYVGKSDPANPYAEDTVSQGGRLYGRLREHSKSIQKGGFSLGYFSYRFATVQSGLQAAVEDFLIRFFRPIWNKEVGIVHGFGKHGDSAGTRGNKRSPWDTMHPGRKWAADTKENQVERAGIVANIAEHFRAHPPIQELITLQQLLTRSAPETSVSPPVEEEI